MSVAFAHSAFDPPPPVYSSEFYLKWDWDPTLLFFVLMAILYFRGLRAFRGRKPVAKWQVGCFYLGIIVLITALVPPIDPWADQLFFVHMIQHLMITLVGVPLILFGVPFFIVLRGMPPWVRRKIYFPLLRSKLIRSTFGFLSKPLPALILYEFTFLFWHVPYFYNLALYNDVIHSLEHATFAISAMFLWRNLIDPYPMRSSLSLPARILALAVVTASEIILSAMLTFSDSVWYAYEGLPTPDFWQFSHLEDQQLGGLIMWIFGGMILFFAMTVTFFVWVNREQEKERQALELEKSQQGNQT